MHGAPPLSEYVGIGHAIVVPQSTLEGDSYLLVYVDELVRVERTRARATYADDHQAVLPHILSVIVCLILA
jgi:UTP-glucose-1-phosphate uridylyltransferase